MNRPILDLFVFITILPLSSLQWNLDKQGILHRGMISWNEHFAFPRAIRVGQGKGQKEKRASQEVMDETCRSEQDIPPAQLRTLETSKMAVQATQPAASMLQLVAMASSPDVLLWTRQMLLHCHVVSRFLGFVV